MRASVTTQRRRGGWWFLALIFGLGAVMIFVQQRHASHHRPLLAAEMAQAEAEGEQVFARLGTPPGAQPLGPGEKRYGAAGRRSRWNDVGSGLTYEREFDTPGDFASLAAWYREHLPSDGWTLVEQSPPTEVQKIFRKGKWLVTIWSRGDFTHPPRTRLHVRLEWDYWHRTW
jgi:hypothetical protein